MEMREALEAAVSEQEKHEPETTPEIQGAAAETPPTTVQPDDQSAPDAERKVDTAKADAGAVETAKPDAAGKKAEVPPAKADEQVQPGQHRVDRAPASWKKEAKGAWAAVPLHIRQEVYRREMEINRALEDANRSKQAAQQFEQAAVPYMARLQSLNATPQQAFQHLLNADYRLATGTPQQKAQLIDKLLQDYGVDITELDRVIAARLGGQQPTPAQPDITQLVQQQLQQALAPIYQQQQQAQQAQQQQVEQTVEQMSLDPKYPYFDELRDDMADLMEINSRRGVYITLEQAYNKAVQMNPEVSAQVQRQASMSQANQQHLQAQRVKAAASSVSGAPAGGGDNKFVGDGSMRGDLEAAFANMRI